MTTMWSMRRDSGESISASHPIWAILNKEADHCLGSPRCPQIGVDVRHLLRIPEDFDIPKEPEDEFECLNLEVTCPPVGSTSGSLPVLIWIHGISRQISCTKHNS